MLIKSNTSISASVAMLKPLAVWITNNSGKVLKAWEYQTTIMDRNGMDLTEVEDIKKRWQDTQKNYTKKIFMTQITMMV